MTHPISPPVAGVQTAAPGGIQDAEAGDQAQGGFLALLAQLFSSAMSGKSPVDPSEPAAGGTQNADENTPSGGTGAETARVTVAGTKTELAVTNRPDPGAGAKPVSLAGGTAGGFEVPEPAVKAGPDGSTSAREQSTRGIPLMDVAEGKPDQPARGSDETFLRRPAPDRPHESPPALTRVYVHGKEQESSGQELPRTEPPAATAKEPGELEPRSSLPHGEKAPAVPQSGHVSAEKARLLERIEILSGSGARGLMQGDESVKEKPSGGKDTSSGGIVPSAAEAGRSNTKEGPIVKAAVMEATGGEARHVGRQEKQEGAAGLLPAEGERTPGADSQSSRPVIMTAGLPETSRSAPELNMPRPAGVKTPFLSPELSRSVLGQIARGMELQIAGKVAELHLRLEPETLGKVGLRVRMEEGRLQAQIDVSQPSVKAALESHLPQLRQALTSQGINVDRLDVFTRGESFSREAAGGHQGKGRHRPEQDVQGQDTGYEATRSLGYNTIELVM